MVNDELDFNPYNISILIKNYELKSWFLPPQYFND